jgi:hypothetical protein
MRKAPLGRGALVCRATRRKEVVIRPGQLIFLVLEDECTKWAKELLEPIVTLQRQDCHFTVTVLMESGEKGRREKFQSPLGAK